MDIEQPTEILKKVFDYIEKVQPVLKELQEIKESFRDSDFNNRLKVENQCKRVTKLFESLGKQVGSVNSLINSTDNSHCKIVQSDSNLFNNTNSNTISQDLEMNGDLEHASDKNGSTLNNCDNEKSDVNDVDNSQGEQSQDGQQFGRLKLVDINKLLETKMEVPEYANPLTFENKNDSVLVISDSEEENGEELKSQIQNKLKLLTGLTLTKTSKNKTNVTVTVLSSDSSDNERPVRSKIQKESISKTYARKKSNIEKKKSVEIAGSSKDKEMSVDISDDNTSENNKAIENVKKDPKFSWKVSIPLAKVDAQNLHDNYYTKLENKLCSIPENITTSNKTKRTRSFSSDSSLDEILFSKNKKNKLRKIAASTPKNKETTKAKGTLAKGSVNQDKNKHVSSSNDDTSSGSDNDGDGNKNNDSDVNLMESIEFQDNLESEKEAQQEIIDESILGALGNETAITSENDNNETINTTADEPKKKCNVNETNESQPEEEEIKETDKQANESTTDKNDLENTEIEENFSDFISRKDKESQETLNNTIPDSQNDESKQEEISDSNNLNTSQPTDNESRQGTNSIENNTDSETADKNKDTKKKNRYHKSILIKPSDSDDSSSSDNLNSESEKTKKKQQSKKKEKSTKPKIDGKDKKSNESYSSDDDSSGSDDSNSKSSRKLKKSKNKTQSDKKEKQTGKNNKQHDKKLDKTEKQLDKTEKQLDRKGKSYKSDSSNSDEDTPLKSKNVLDLDSNNSSNSSTIKRKESKKSANSDSESDNFETFLKMKKAKPQKTKKRQRLLLDSDSDKKSKASNKSSDDDSSDKRKSESEEEVKPKPKKSRIKRLKASSDEDNDDEKSTRKHIRKVWHKDSLQDSTIAAEKEERERKLRILEKQKKYNSIFEPDKLEKDTIDKVVLDFDEETKEELLSVDLDIVKSLKPHQGQGIQFMWNACFESLKRAKKSVGSGCILAHCMGLGKTLQVISLIHTLLKDSEKSGIAKVLVVCPVNTVLNWKAEFEKWMPDEDDFDVYELSQYKQNSERSYTVKYWHDNGGTLILGYDMFRNLTNETNKRIPKKFRAIFQTCLVDPGADLVVCDEGHLLKNEKTSLSIAMNKIKSLRRIVLTGTPLQNNLKEYYCMVQFVKPNLLGTFKEYSNRFVNPITNGQYTDSTPSDIQVMRRRSHVLHKLLDGIVQRKDYSVLEPFLPPKLEYVLFISLTETQVKLYEHYMREFAKRNSDSKRTSSLFADFQALQRICTHPRVLLDKSIEEKKKEVFLDEDESEGSLKDFIDDDGSASDTSMSSKSGNGSDKGSVKSQKSSQGSKSNDEQPIFKRKTRQNAAEFVEEEQPQEEDFTNNLLEWWREYCNGDELNNIAHSGKLMILYEILKECELIGDKVLIFSQSLYSLNLIEYFLAKIDEATQNGETEKTCGFSGSWSPGLDYYRLDGSTACEIRANDCKRFNDPNNARARLFLISTRAGGLGINLVGANRVIIFDVSWNPSHDIQSIYRVYRFGQTKPTYVYRLVTMGAMEMKVYERQVTKQAISKRVIDEQQIDRHYNQNDLAELYKFEPYPGDRPVPLVPKDVLLAEMLQKQEKLIYKYHEHQSLLENKEEEGLNEEERKAAWDEFENEKKNRNTTGFMNGVPMNLIYLAVSNIVKRDNPTWDEKRIQTLLPTIVRELTIDIQSGNVNKYARVLSEVRAMQAAQYQFQQQQQAAIWLKHYQQQFLNNNANINANLPNRNMAQNFPLPSTSTSNPEVIDLDG